MKKLKELRMSASLTVNDISKLVGISPTYYWQIENKQRRLYYELAKKIAKVFNKKPDEIFFEEYK
ncbi:MAG: helix-turn-helix transcriptional regulator [Bacilli bacterium]|nr:helix-turn-helix transcriptional regulator [Bacilli bacterium]